MIAGPQGTFFRTKLATLTCLLEFFVRSHFHSTYSQGPFTNLSGAIDHLPVSCRALLVRIFTLKYILRRLTPSSSFIRSLLVHFAIFQTFEVFVS